MSKKRCHRKSAIYAPAEDCIVPMDEVFTRVPKGGSHRSRKGITFIEGRP